MFNEVLSYSEVTPARWKIPSFEHHRSPGTRPLSALPNERFTVRTGDVPCSWCSAVSKHNPHNYLLQYPIDNESARLDTNEKSAIQHPLLHRWMILMQVIAGTLPDIMYHWISAREAETKQATGEKIIVIWTDPESAPSIGSVARKSPTPR